LRNETDRLAKSAQDLIDYTDKTIQQLSDSAVKASHTGPFADAVNNFTKSLLSRFQGGPGNAGAPQVRCSSEMKAG
jgi:hypothetical protein